MAYKFDAVKLKEVKEHVAIGITDCNAVVLAFGVDRATFFRWMSDDSPLSEKDKSDLKKALQNGRAALNQRMSLLVVKAADAGDGKLALEVIKRRESGVYGDSMKLSGDKNNPIRHEHSITKEQLKRILGDK